MLFGMEYEFQIQLDLEYQVSLGKVDPDLLEDERYITVPVIWNCSSLSAIPTINLEFVHEDLILSIKPAFFRDYLDKTEGGLDLGNIELRNSQPHEYVSDAIEEIRDELLPRLVEMLSAGLKGICDFAIFTPKTLYRLRRSYFNPSKHLNISAGRAMFHKLFTKFKPLAALHMQTKETAIAYNEVQYGERHFRIHLNLPYRFEDYEALLNAPEELGELATPENIKNQPYNKVSLVGYSEYLCDEWHWHEDIV